MAPRLYIRPAVIASRTPYGRSAPQSTRTSSASMKPWGSSSQTWPNGDSTRFKSFTSRSSRTVACVFRRKSPRSSGKSGMASGGRRSSMVSEARFLRFLDGHGAFEDFIALQEKLAALEVEAASLRDQFKAAEMLEGQKTQLNVDRANIRRRLQEDHQARKSKAGPSDPDHWARDWRALRRPRG